MHRRQFTQAALAALLLPILPFKTATAIGTIPVLLSPGAVYCSPEMLADMRNWGCDRIDKETRREILLNGFNK